MDQPSTCEELSIYIKSSYQSSVLAAWKGLMTASGRLGSKHL